MTASVDGGPDGVGPGLDGGGQDAGEPAERNAGEPAEGKADQAKKWKTRRRAGRSADREAMSVAARQWSALSRAQAIKAGLTRNQIAYRLQTGQWRQPVREVYVVAGTPDCWEQKVMIACLSGPAGTTASHLQRKLIEWGFPRAERQIEVFDEAGKFVARADVGIRELNVLFEYDSDEHHGPRFWLADDARQGRLEELGWTVVVIDRFDLRPSSTRLKEELEKLSLLRSGGIIPPERTGELPRRLRSSSAA